MPRKLKTAWKPCGIFPGMPDRAIHIWRISLDIPDAMRTNLWALLSDKERRRAERFTRGHLTRRCIAARGAKRTILASYLHRAPDRLAIKTGKEGKPYLADDALHFNLTHSKDLALLAVSASFRIGVDLEFHDRNIQHARVARRFFSRAEVRALAALPARDRPQAFFNCWTRKEAYIKLRGAGIGMGLSSFDVTLSPDRPAMLLRSEKHPEDVRGVFMTAFDAGTGTVAALASDGPPAEVCFFDFHSYAAGHDLL